MAEGHELPWGSGDIRFLNEYVLRCNLVHFETQSCHILSLDREYLLHVHWPRRGWMIFAIFYLSTVMITIFGGGGGSWAFCGEKLLPLKYPR